MKRTEPSLVTMNRQELASFCKGLLIRLHELEDLVQVISRGKYAWEATFDAITEPVMIVTQDFKVDRANLAMAHHGNQDITQVVGKKCYEVFAHRHSPCEGCPLRQALEEGELAQMRLGNKIDHAEFYAHAYPLYDEKGQLHSAVLYYRDITEEIRLRQEVIQQEKMAAIGMLAGGVAHEINNPLGGVLAFTQLILKKLDEKTEMYEDLKEIEHAATRCKKIVQELLDFSRISREKEKSPVYLNTLIEKVMPFIQMDIRSLNIDLKMNVQDHLPPVLAIPNRLQQVLLNLITNAIHSMPHGGNLDLATFHEKKSDEVCFMVRDTGAGIPEEIRERIFEPFFTTKEPGKGTGLGLSISFRIVKENNGRVEVESEVGKGSTFTVRLPAAAVE